MDEPCVVVEEMGSLGEVLDVYTHVPLSIHTRGYKHGIVQKKLDRGIRDARKNLEHVSIFLKASNQFDTRHDFDVESRLPDEMLIHIALFAGNRWVMARVCRRWKRVMELPVMQKYSEHRWNLPRLHVYYCVDVPVGLRGFQVFRRTPTEKFTDVIGHINDSDFVTQDHGSIVLHTDNAKRTIVNGYVVWVQVLLDGTVFYCNDQAFEVFVRTNNGIRAPVHAMPVWPQVYLAIDELNIIVATELTMFRFSRLDGQIWNSMLPERAKFMFATDSIVYVGTLHHVVGFDLTTGKRVFTSDKIGTEDNPICSVFCHDKVCHAVFVSARDSLYRVCLNTNRCLRLDVPVRTRSLYAMTMSPQTRLLYVRTPQGVWAV